MSLCASIFLMVYLVGATITVIEGNYSNAVKRRTLQVNGRYIPSFLKSSMCFPQPHSVGMMSVSPALIAQAEAKVEGLYGGEGGHPLRNRQEVRDNRREAGRVQRDHQSQHQVA